MAAPSDVTEDTGGDDGGKETEDLIGEMGDALAQGRVAVQNLEAEMSRLALCTERWASIHTGHRGPELTAILLPHLREIRAYGDKMLQDAERGSGALSQVRTLLSSFPPRAAEAASLLLEQAAELRALTRCLAARCGETERLLGGTPHG